jgi:integrase/recombinase XerD
MPKHHPQNERIKRQYFEHLRHARGLSDATIDPVAQAIARFEAYTGNRDFRRFHIEQAKAFKRSLAQQLNQRTGEPLSKSTLHTTLNALKAFFQWLSREPGYRSRLNYSDAEYFNLSDKEARIAKARRDHAVPSLEQIQHVLGRMPARTEIERRDQALIAFTLLSGARDAAIASMRLKHIDIERGLVFQDAREVHTKFAKTFTSVFFPVGDELLTIVSNWVRYLRTELLWGPDDPLFPATRIGHGPERNFRAAGLMRKCWSNADPIRRIFKASFASAGLPYFNPHSFRKTLVALGQQRCRTPEEFKAWSQNLGHEDVLTTFTSYGEVAPHRQAQIIQQLSKPQTSISDAGMLFRQLAEQADAGTLRLPQA